MGRNDREKKWEEDYLKRLESLKGIQDDHLAFLSTFTLPGYEKNDFDNSSEADGSDGSFTGGTNEEIVWNFFAAKGFSEASIAGIMGNLYHESGINPERKQQLGGGLIGRGRGLCQWETPGRWDTLTKRAKKEGKDPLDLGFQLEFLWWELEGGDSTTKSILNKRFGGMNGLKKASDYKWAVKAFENSFERASKKNMDARYGYAKKYLDKFGTGSPGKVAKTVGTSTITVNATGGAKKVIKLAESWINKPNRYVFGGGRSKADINSGRFDCSSFMRYIFWENGKDIMNNNGALWGNTDTIVKNKKLKKIKTSELRPGDLVFYHTYKQYGHVAVYVGNDKAIGTQSSTGVEVIDHNSKYWKGKLSKDHRRVF